MRKIKIFVASALMIGLASPMFGNVSVRFSGLPLRKAMREIEKVSKLHFLYNASLEGLDAKVSLVAKDMPEEQALSRLFAGTRLDYRMDKNNVVVFQRKETAKVESRTESQDNNRRIEKVKVTGTVVDQDGEPLIGATVKARDSKLITSTDTDGNFTFQAVNNGDNLEISYIGFGPQTVKVNKAGSYKVSLKNTTASLNELVVVGYGSQKKVNLTGAVSVIEAKDLNGRPTGNAATALQGADPSLNLSMSSGGPNSGASINIRGVASINGGKPLILVDGVEMDLTRISANDIESVSILKDASAAAVYGAKASAGVVLVTTKSGNSEANPRITFDLKGGWRRQTVSEDFETNGFWSVLINDQAKLYNDGTTYTNYDENDYAQLWMRLDQKVESAERPWAVPTTDKHWRYYANNDWYSHYYRKARPMQDYNVSITGGAKKVKYYVSGRAYLEDGALRAADDKFDSYSMRAKLDVDLNRWMRYRLNSSFFESTYTRLGSSDINDFFYRSCNHALSAFPSTNPDGTSLWDISGIITLGTAKVGDGYNALMNYGMHKNKDQQREFLFKNALEISPTSWWKIIGDYAYLYRNFNREMRRVPVPYSNTEGVVGWIDGAADSMCWDMFTRGMTNNATQTTNVYTTIDPSFGEHNIKLTAGFNGEVYRHLYFKGERQDLMSPSVNTLNIATGEVKDLLDEIQNSVTYGYFGRINYDYAGKYLVELSGRYDGSSRFAKAHRWGFFPSASAGWRFSEEKFFEPLHSWWSNGKVRLSYGSLGNQQVGYYDYIQKITTNQLMDNLTFDGTTYVPYASVSAPPSSNLTWEKVITYNLGADLGFFNNRLNMSGEIYIRDTKDMLTSGANLPLVYGASVPKANCADLRTRGWEFSVNWNDSFILGTTPLFYGVGAGIGDYVSKITKFDNPNKLLSSYYEGQILGEIWGYEVDGLFATDEEAADYMSRIDGSTYVYTDIYSKGALPGLHAGDVRYVDVNGDGMITPGEGKVGSTGDRRIIGNSLPRYNYNIRGNAEWNGIDFSIFFQGVGHRDWYPGNEARTFWGPYCRPYNAYLPKGFLQQIWTEDNPEAYFPRLRAYEALGGSNTLGNVNTRYLQNLAYLRLKNLTIGYTLPVLKKYIPEVRVYFSGENLAYWSPLKKNCATIDPETTANSGRKTNDGLSYGFSKSYTFGVNLTF